MKIDIEYAKSILDYNHDTGLFTRKVSSGRGKAGSIAGHLKDNGYIQMYVNYKRIGGHRLAWAFHYGYFPNEEIDHINCIPSDNRISNLRLCTRAQNSANIPKRTNNKSGIKGVCWHKKSKKWTAQICANYKIIKLGYFENIKDAELAYKEAANKYHGNFARL